MYNVDCANNYDLFIFKVTNNCKNSIDLVRLKAISVFLNKPQLCKQKEFDYKISLFIKKCLGLLKQLKSVFVCFNHFVL